MKARNLLPAVATLVFLAIAAPTDARASEGAAATHLELNTAVTRRVHEEGLNPDWFELTYTPDFVGHGGRRTFTHPTAWR